MRKFIGTIAIIITLYLGFFGCEQHNIDPFILEWFESEQADSVKETVEEVSKDVKDAVEDAGDGIEKAFKGK